MKTVLAVRHVPFEDLGTFEGVLKRRGYAISYLDIPTANLSDINFVDPGILVVLGGPIGVYESEVYPFLSVEIALIKQRLARELPTIGICLGCQLMAHALGAAVYPSGTKEIGWGPLQFSDAAASSVLAPLVEKNPSVLHWHGDTFDLPENVTHLAATEPCKNQAFSIGHFALALQFHLEASQAGLETWFVGHAGEIAATPGISVNKLREDTVKWADSLEPIAERVFESWIDQIGQ